MTKELIMYTRSASCPFVSLAHRVLAEHGVSYREIFIDKDSTASQRVKDWTGFLSVPTLVIAPYGSYVPDEPITPLAPNKSPRGIDRGPMITEPSASQLTEWLARHGFITIELEDDNQNG